MDGANGCHWSLYVLHAEMDDLLWDMSSLSEKRIFLIRFKMDYANLLKVTKEIYQIGSFQKKKIYQIGLFMSKSDLFVIIENSLQI